jgi:hypothetical protein
MVCTSMIILQVRAAYIGSNPAKSETHQSSRPY